MKSKIYLGLNGIHVLLMVKLNIDVFPSALKRTKQNIVFTVAIWRKHSRHEESISLHLLESEFFLSWNFFLLKVAALLHSSRQLTFIAMCVYFTVTGNQ